MVEKGGYDTGIGYKTGTSLAKKKGADVGERRENERKREAEGMALAKKRDADTGSMGIEMLGGGKEENLGR
jgi:hypothetical protein